MKLFRSFDLGLIRWLSWKVTKKIYPGEAVCLDADGAVQPFLRGSDKIIGVALGPAEDGGQDD